METCTTVEKRREPFIRTLITAHFHGRKHIGPSGEHFPTYKKCDWLLSHGFDKEEARDIIADARHRVFAEEGVRVLGAPHALGVANISDDNKAEVSMLLAGMHISPIGAIHHHVDLYPCEDGTVFMQLLDRKFQMVYEGDVTLCSHLYTGDENITTLIDLYMELRDEEHGVPIELLRETEQIIEHQLPYAMMVQGKGFEIYSSVYHCIAVITKRI